MSDLLSIGLQNLLHGRESNLRNQAKAGGPLSAHLHLFAADGLHLVFDVGSGSLHRLDQVAWTFLKHLVATGDWAGAREEAAKSFRTGEVEEAVAEICALAEEGLLFGEDEWHSFAPGADLGLKALCLNVAHSCNLACRYCFVPSGLRNSEEIMPLEVVRAALDFLIRETPYEFLAVDFFGGEPLLNFAGVQEAVAYALEAGKHKKWKFTLTTNALLLDEEVLSFLRKHNFCLVLSCDGRPETHDRYRVMPGGGGSAARVEERIRDFLATGGIGEYYIRGTYTRRNLHFTEDVLYLADLGAKSISLEPVAAPGGEPYALRWEDLPVLKEEYLKLARILRAREREGKEFAFYHFCLDLQGGPCVAKRLTGCGAGYQYLCVTPNGELYPCHQLAGNPACRMGDVWQGVTSPELQKKFREAHVYRKEPCRSCWARFLCGGGCHAQALLRQGGLFRPDPLACALMRARLEGALYYLALGAETGEGREALA